MHRSGSCRGRSSLYLASRGASLRAHLLRRRCQQICILNYAHLLSRGGGVAVAGVSLGAAGGWWGEGGPRPARHAPCGFKMRRMTFISRCLLRMRPRDFRLRTTPAKWE